MSEPAGSVSEAAATAEPPVMTARFKGLRPQLFGLLLRGYVLLVPTLGIYRFWLITQKRRYYWSRTRLGDDALEYTGTATEILFGFLVAIAIFVPFYMFFFYIGTQTPTVALIGLVAALLALFLLSGFALFRSRRYRLTRTLWRGIRFHQTGSAWAYAFMRLGWYLLTALTLGLTFPFMAASLFRYRYNNTWYGDRQVSFDGSWKQLAGPFYGVWALLAVLVAASIAAFVDAFGGAIAGLTVSSLTVLVGLAAIPYISARERTRFTSRIRIGDAPVSLHIRARALIGMYLVYALVLLAVALVAATAVAYVVSGSFAISTDFGVDFGAILSAFEQSSWLTVAAFAAAYLLAIATLAMVAELFIGLTFWRMVVTRLKIANPESLDTVRARGERAPAIGEGLADALGSGGY